jgi:hypothetical protein
MYPLAPVRRMRDFSGTAAEPAVDLLGTLASGVFTSDLQYDLGLSEGVSAAPPLPSLNYFLFMLFLIRSRVARYSLLSGSDANAFSMEAIASAFFSTPIAINA